MDLIIAQVEEIRTTADNEARKTLIDTLRNLSISLEEPGDTIQRLAYLVSLPESDRMKCVRFSNSIVLAYPAFSSSSSYQPGSLDYSLCEQRGQECCRVGQDHGSRSTSLRLVL